MLSSVIVPTRSVWAISCFLDNLCSPVLGLGRTLCLIATESCSSQELQDFTYREQVMIYGFNDYVISGTYDYAARPVLSES